LSKVFADTSALHALLSVSDTGHDRARRSFERLRSENAALVTTSYVLVETYALMDRRLGREASRRFRDEMDPLLDVVWVDRDLHEKAMDLFLASAHSVSLVDAASFVCIRERSLDRVWAIDRHFDDQGFEIVE
jgi:predicted nucleic acid-binding protein